ncbi:MAG TPA: PVC-type heme-binding CxxCH protein, partial [Planctomycetota bacterium]|nr:PVC-type heme-binding CxxCH protein [Planctomycetota bacterium]
MSYPTFATPLVPLIVSVLLGVPAFGADDPPPRDTQPVDGAIPTPAEALASLRLPEGFRATLFASEPDVRQPIAFAFDERGRLWVAENYTYAEREVGFADDLRDRIVILEDEDGDGRADKRTVFADDLSKLTSIEIGLGGVWALCAPHLVFFADGDRDDRPDGEPEIHLDGFQSDEDIRHNVVNGLRWGPDGWLWGRHGILATSLVGRPGSPSAERVPINCGMWRYHPTRRVFEAVVHGTTNPWGHDWDEHGELFFINTVIGHLWHVLPGAHYERMYGEDLRPHLYSL